MLKLEDEIMSFLQIKKIKVEIVEKSPILYFYLKKTDKYQYLKDRINDNIKDFKEKLESKNYRSVNYKSDKNFYIFGIITKNEGGLYLINTIDGSNDTFIKLNLNFLRKYSFFEGQIVSLKGKNLSGNEFIVEEYDSICQMLINERESKKDFVVNFVQNVNEAFFRKKLSEDDLILVGCDIIEEIEIWAKEHLDRNILHVPYLTTFKSINVFPQSPIETISNIKCISNPSEFYLNDYLVAINTLTVIDELKKQEIMEISETGCTCPCAEILFENDEIDRLCIHLLFQASYYPLMSSEYNIKYKYDFLKMSTHPDLYIIRSAIYKPFLRVLGPTTIVNIGMIDNWNIKCSNSIFQINKI